MPRQTLTIPFHSIETLERSVKTLARHARRMSVAEPTLRVLRDTRREEDQTRVVGIKSEDGILDQASRRIVEIVDVELETPEMGASSGKFRSLAALQNLGKGEDGKPMIEVFSRNLADAERVKPFKAGEFCCDHCMATRNRTWSIMVEEVATKKMLQLGRECADAYIADPEGEIKALQFQELLYTLVHEYSGEGERPGLGSSTLKIVDPIEVASHSIASVRHAGWTSRWMGEEYAKRECPASTAACVALRLNMRSGKDFPGGDRNGADKYTVTPEDLAQGEEALAWIATAKDDNEFLAGLRELYAPGWVSEKKIHFAASIGVAWQREKERRIEAAKPPSQYVSEAKKRFQTEVCVVRSHRWQTDFGLKTAYIMEDRGGNTLVWMTTGNGFPDTARDRANWFAIKGTVKDHKEYKGVKQTELSRVMIERDFAGEKIAAHREQREAEFARVRGLSVEERLIIAASKDTAQDVIENLYGTDQDAEVRAAVAGNPNTGANVLAGIASYSDDEALLLRVLANPALPAASLEAIRYRESASLLRIVAKDPRMAVESLSGMAWNRDAGVRQAVCENPRLIAELETGPLARLSTDQDPAVRAAAEATLRRLATLAKEALEKSGNDPIDPALKAKLSRILVAELKMDSRVATAPTAEPVPSPRADIREEIENLSTCFSEAPRKTASISI